jgi:hypothetical protein
VKYLAVLAIIVVVALAAAGSALALIYAGPQQWSANQTAGSSYSSSWITNDFAKVSGGPDTTVAFIDNRTYSWHATVRNTSQITHTAYFGPEVRKGHCKANVGGFWGSCAVHS